MAIARKPESDVNRYNDLRLAADRLEFACEALRTASTDLVSALSCAQRFLSALDVSRICDALTAARENEAVLRSLHGGIGGTCSALEEKLGREEDGQ